MPSISYLYAELFWCKIQAYRNFVSFLDAEIANNPDSKGYGANMGPTWGQQDPGGPPVGPMNLAIWEGLTQAHYWDRCCKRLMNLCLNFFLKFLSLILILMIQSCYKFANTITALLLWHVEICQLIVCLWYTHEEYKLTSVLLNHLWSVSLIIKTRQQSMVYMLIYIERCPINGCRYKLSTDLMVIWFKLWYKNTIESNFGGVYTCQKYWVYQSIFYKSYCKLQSNYQSNPINSLWPNDATWCHGSSVKVMTYLLWRSKSLPYSMLNYCPMDPWEQTSVKFEWK